MKAVGNNLLNESTFFGCLFKFLKAVVEVHCGSGCKICFTIYVFEMGPYDSNFLGNIIEAIFRIPASAFVNGYDGMNLGCSI